MIWLVLIAMVAFMVWAIVHTHARIGWPEDERLAEEFLAALRDAGDAR